MHLSSSNSIFRGTYPPAEEYVKYADRSPVNLVEAFRSMQIDEDALFENGGLNHEVTLSIEIYDFLFLLVYFVTPLKSVFFHM